MVAALPGDGQLRASAGWQEGDPVGGRRFADVGAVRLERGGLLPDVRVAYETWGEPTPARDNAVLVLHALTGDSHVIGEAGPGHPTPGWWNGLIGPGLLIDPAKWWIVCPNVLGGCQGTTGPSSISSFGLSSPGSLGSPPGARWGSRWPRTTVRDQVEVERRLADLLGIQRWQVVLGGSMGGMRALEWAVSFPDRVAGLGVVASTAAASADQIGFSMPQLAAIRSDPYWQGGDYYGAPPNQRPHQGMGIARRIAHLTYRSATELDQRFGRQAQVPSADPLDGGRWRVESYLDHHADKLAGRFDAGSYVALTEAMNSHDVGRDRGGVRTALSRVTARTVVAGIDSDRLYPLAQQDEIAAGIDSAGPTVRIRSTYGHDAFLIETDQIRAALRPLFE